ncbi:hypothetical protein ACQ4LE_003624 [Meloidogyne hapla]
MIIEKEYVEVRLLFFGKAREIIGLEMLMKTIPRIIKIHELYTIVFEQTCPLLLPVKNSCILAVDHEYFNTNENEEIILNESSEIAIVPPISGG